MRLRDSGLASLLTGQVESAARVCHALLAAVYDYRWRSTIGRIKSRKIISHSSFIK